MKKRGFTLIELLAVIIILAIIVLIATLIIMNVIENSKRGAAERSAQNYIRAVETEVMTRRTQGETLEGTYSINSDGEICDEEEICIPIEMSGTKPSGGKIILIEGKVSSSGTSIIIGNYKATISSHGNVVAVKYEPICMPVTTSDKGNVPEGNFAYGDEYICNVDGTHEYHFYVLESEEASGAAATTSTGKVSLIMEGNLCDGNTIATKNTCNVAYCSDENLCKVNGSWDSNADPITANAALADRTSEWVNLNTSQITLPTSDQIYAVYNSKNIPIDSWLFDNLNTNTGPWGYWVATTWSTKVVSITTWNPWGKAGLGFDMTHMYNAGAGIRPVITLSKADLG